MYIYIYTSIFRLPFEVSFSLNNKRIRNRPLKIYKYIYDLITVDTFYFYEFYLLLLYLIKTNSLHWLHCDLRSLIFKSTPDNLVFGHAVERIWTILFNCFKPDLYDRCRKKECACFDEA